MKNILTKLLLLAFAAAALSACQTTGRASLAGECAAFQNPGFAVQGKRRLDQRVIDHWLETGIVVCSWPRPKSDTPR
jgi:predicted RNA methylase